MHYKIATKWVYHIFIKWLFCTDVLAQDALWIIAAVMKASERFPLLNGTSTIIYNVYLWMTHQEGISESSLACNKMLTAQQAQHTKKALLRQRGLPRDQQGELFSPLNIQINAPLPPILLPALHSSLLQQLGKSHSSLTSEELVLISSFPENREV